MTGNATTASASENDEAARSGTQRSRAKARTTGGSAAAIKGLFRDIVRAVVRRAGDAPQPKPRRRSGETGRALRRFEPLRATQRAIERDQGSGRHEQKPPPHGSFETGKAFGAAARAALPRVARIPAEAYAAATAYLSDTLDWLNLWEDNSADDSNELDAAYDTNKDHSFPHL